MAGRNVHSTTSVPWKDPMSTVLRPSPGETIRPAADAVIEDEPQLRRALQEQQLRGPRWARGVGIALAILGLFVGAVLIVRHQAAGDRATDVQSGAALNPTIGSCYTITRAVRDDASDVLAEAACDSDVRPAFKAVQQITAEETRPGTYTTLARGKASTADARGYCMMPMFTVGHCYAASDLAPGQPVGQPAVPCDSPKAVAAISRMAEGIADVTLCAGKVGVVMSLKPVRTYCYVTAG